MMREASKNGYTTVKELADALKYRSTEKLYRLKRDPNNKPSFEIIEDLTNLFDILDLRYLITGVESNTKYISDTIDNSMVAEDTVLYNKIKLLKELFSNDEKLDTIIEMLGNKFEKIEDRLHQITLLKRVDDIVDKENG